MAGVFAIHAMTSGLAQHLSRAYELRPVPSVSCKFEPLASSDMKKLDGQDTKVTVLLYRLTHNEHLRNRPSSSLPWGQPVPLTVNLHLLVTVWADSALKEQSLLAWTLRELHLRPVLDRSVLAASGAFGANDQLALTPEEMSLDDMTKLWQVLVPPYRPSLAYVARNIAIDLEREPDHAPVVATRVTLDDDPQAVAEGAR